MSAAQWGNSGPATAASAVGSGPGAAALPGGGVHGNGSVPGAVASGVGEAAAGGGAEGTAAKRRRWPPRTVRHVAELLVVALILDIFVVPQIGGTHKALHALATVNPLLPLAGLLLEVLSIVSYFELTRSVIPKGSDPGFAAVSRIQLSTLALSHCLPGGNAAGYSLGYRLLMRTGMKGTDTGFALATLGLGSAVVLNAIFWLALLISLPFYGLQPVYLVAAIAGLLLMIVIAGLMVLLTKGDQRAMRVLRAVGAKLHFLHPETLPRVFSQLLVRVEEISKDRRQLLRAVSFATANWLFDAASLLVFVGAFGRWVNPVAVLVAYGVANILAVIPVTPGGLVVVEASLSGILVLFGVPREIAILGVLGYRLVNFWLPIPVGGAAYLSLKVHPPAEDQAGLAARRALWRARWRWMVDLFGRETPTPALETSLPVIERVLEGNPPDVLSPFGGTEALEPAEGGMGAIGTAAGPPPVGPTA